MCWSEENDGRKDQKERKKKYPGIHFSKSPGEGWIIGDEILSELAWCRVSRTPRPIAHRIG